MRALCVWFARFAKNKNSKKHKTIFALPLERRDFLFFFEIWKDSRCRPGIPTKGGGGWTGFLETFPVKGKSTRQKGTKWPLFLKPGIMPGRQMTSWNDPPGNGQKRQVTAKFQADSFAVHAHDFLTEGCKLDSLQSFCHKISNHIIC